MKLFRSAFAVIVTEGIIALGLWKLGVFPVLLLAISLSSKWGYPIAVAGFFVLTWALWVLWLWFFNRRRKHDKKIEQRRAGSVSQGKPRI